MKVLRSFALLTLAALAVATVLVPTCRAQMAAAPAAHPADPWWKHAVFYEIYPRSFQDSNGDGTGDLNGITERLDKLKELGVDAIWIAPCYPSPQVDFGYDISDYENIDPQYGTLKDFDRLVAEAKKRNIRIVMDMVLNHTSDKHKWFEESASSRDNPKRDWYVWRDGKKGPNGEMEPPNNWISAFGHSAWKYDARTGQYYYHKFYAEQPDLNWRNPAVEKAMFDSMRFWLDRGVAGFRLDAIPTLFEDPTLADEEYVKDKDGKIEINAFGDKTVDGKKSENLPEVHGVIERMRAMVASYPSTGFPGDRLLIGETYLPNVAELYKWYGGDKMDELQLPMDFMVGMENRLDAAGFRKHIGEAVGLKHGATPLFVFDNHDNPRLDRYCTAEAGAPMGADCGMIQKMLSTTLFTSKAAALMYYGDEIGMSTTPPTRVEDVQDPVGRTGWPREKGRDGDRTPMQWTDGKDAGFSTADKTWLPIPPSYVTVNWQTEDPQKTSLLDWYKRLIALRRTEPALVHGEQIMLTTNRDSDVLAYERKDGSATVVVLCNFSSQPQSVSVEGMGMSHGSVLAANFAVAGKGEMKLSEVQLPGYGAVVAELK